MRTLSDVILFDNVTKTYSRKARPALGGVSLEILKGEFVFLVGASGSGKSTMIRLMMREEQPQTRATSTCSASGSPRSRTAKCRSSVATSGSSSRTSGCFANKTVYENVAFTLQVIGKSRGFISEAVPDVLKIVGLAGKSSRFPHELSGGEQQRVAIARAVVNKPPILLADEPTGNLDPATSAGIMALLARINEGGTTVVMATHEASIVDAMQRRVIEVDSGKIVRDQKTGAYGSKLSTTPSGKQVTVNENEPMLESEDAEEAGA